MAGHSKFKNIMHRKGRQDALRAKTFTRALKEVQVAVKLGGPEIDNNPRLRMAIKAAKSQNVPGDNIDRVIKKASGSDAENLDEIRYEGYGPGGVAIIVECLTDNKNRSASDVRAAFNKHGGSLGETNSVSFQFDRIGLIAFAKETADAEAMLEAAIEAGAEECESGEENHEITCAPDDLNAVRESLEAALGSPESAILSWRPQVELAVDEEKAQTLVKLLDALDDLDDVQRVISNADISDEIMEKIAS